MIPYPVFSLFIFLNHGWSSASRTVIRVSGCLFNILRSKSFARGEILCQTGPKNRTGSSTIDLSMFLVLNGYIPESIKKSMMPRLQISHGNECGDPSIISGAMKIFDPTMDRKTIVWSFWSLLRPKSTKMGSSVSLSIKMLSGFKSRWTTPTECIWLIPARIFCMITLHLVSGYLPLSQFSSIGASESRGPPLILYMTM